MFMIARRQLPVKQKPQSFLHPRKIAENRRKTQKRCKFNLQIGCGLGSRTIWNGFRFALAIFSGKIIFNFAFGATAFAERSVAMKAPVGLLSGRAVCVSRWRGFAPTSSAERSKRYFHGRGRNGKRHLQRRFLRKRSAAGGRLLPLGGAVAQRLRGYKWRSEKSVKAIAPTGAALAFLCFDFFFRIVKGEQPLARCGVGGVQR